MRIYHDQCSDLASRYPISDAPKPVKTSAPVAVDPICRAVWAGSSPLLDRHRFVGFRRRLTEPPLL